VAESPGKYFIIVLFSRVVLLILRRLSATTHSSRTLQSCTFTPFTPRLPRVRRHYRFEAKLSETKRNFFRFDAKKVFENEIKPKKDKEAKTSKRKKIK
jgi:hypothetical protein